MKTASSITAAPETGLKVYDYFVRISISLYVSLFIASDQSCIPGVESQWDIHKHSAEGTAEKNQVVDFLSLRTQDCI